MLRPFFLQRFDYSAGDSTEKDLNAIPALTRTGKVYYAVAIMLRVAIKTTSASTSDAINQRQWAKIINQFSLTDRNGSYIGMEQPLQGTYLRTLRQRILRDAITKGDPAAVAANSNTNRTDYLTLVLPFVQPWSLKPFDLCPVGRTLSKARIQWDSSGFGTGQTVNGSGATYCEVYALCLPMEQFKAQGRLVYGKTGMKTFTNDTVTVDGHIIDVGFGDFSGGATTTIGSTDFVQYDMAGADGAEAPRQDVNACTVALNALGAQGEAAYSLPTSGSADIVPLLMPHQGDDLGNTPNERELTFNLTVGAGSPSTADQDWYYAVVRAVDPAGWASNLGKAPDMGVTKDAALEAFKRGNAKGNKGDVSSLHPMTPYLPRPVPAAVIKNSTNGRERLFAPTSYGGTVRVK